MLVPALIVWWMVGVVIVIHEARYFSDISFGKLVPIAILGTVGPLAALMTLGRVWNRIVFRKHEEAK